MMTIPGLSSGKILNWERITTLFVVEKKLHLFAFVLITLLVELSTLLVDGYKEINKGGFIILFIVSFFIFALIEYIFRMLMDSKMIPFVSIVPAVLLFFLLRINEKFTGLAIAVLLAVLLRIIFDYMPARDKVLSVGCFLLDGLAVYLRLYWNVFWGDRLIDKLVFVALAVLTLSELQRLIWGRKNGEFPFYYFLLVGTILLFLPMNTDPLDWSRVESAFGNIANSTSYYLSSVIGHSEYTVGYGSLDVKGERITNSSKPQLKLSTTEKPYFVYTDSETGSKMKMRRTIYLSGGTGVEKEQLVQWLQFLHDNGIDKDKAALFSKLSKVDIEYVYIDTADEIAPAGSIFLSNEKGKIEKGKSDSRHRKGYKLKTKYIDIDYGSSYFVKLLSEQHENNTKPPMSYEQAREYYYELYNQELKDVISYKEYEKLTGEPVEKSQYMDTSGVTERMKALTTEIAGGAGNEYDKAKLIESYLRQYKYSTNAVGGHAPESDMSTDEGMADIADRFLFETEQGYCVHFTSAMIMMLRASGIPARAEIGYRYSYPFEISEEYVVEANCAHVWPEAYIDNVGWVPFEPTSTYTTADERSWRREENPVSVKPAFDIPELPERPDVEEATSQKISIQIFKIACIVISSIIALILFVLGGMKIGLNLRYRFATPEKKLLMDVEMIKERLLKLSGITVQDRGLLLDYVKAAPESMKEDVKAAFRAYYRVIYGNTDEHPVSPLESVLARNIRQTLNSKAAKDLF